MLQEETSVIPGLFWGKMTEVREGSFKGVRGQVPWIQRHQLGQGACTDPIGEMVEGNTGGGLVQNKCKEVSCFLFADPEDILGSFLNLKLPAAGVEYHQWTNGEGRVDAFDTNFRWLKDISILIARS
jgi:hypothetical protein